MQLNNSGQIQEDFMTENGAKREKKNRVAFITLGCKVNYYETEKMMHQFRELGFSVVDASEAADIYVINTCTVTNMADRKSRQMIHRAKKKNPDSLVVAVGCYVESAGEEALADTALDAAFSNKDKNGNMAVKILDYFSISTEGRQTAAAGAQETDLQDIDYEGRERTRAYLKIQDGCNQFCSYCLIPYVRGKGELSSMPPEEVVKKSEELAAHGYKEIVLTGIHLSSYGVDFSNVINFVRLEGRPLVEVIGKIAQIPGIERIRLGSLEPRIITESFLEGLSQIPQVCPHFHLSLQSGCDTVLRRMNRHYTTEEYEEKVELIRKYYEHPAVTTDVIVGFPGETDEEFEETREYLRRIELADIHVFKYSERTGTKAAAMEGQINPQIKHERSEKLLADTRKFRKKYSDYFIGREEKVLFEEYVTEDGVEYLTGHNERYVKIGVPREEAEQKNYAENEIHTIKVSKVMKK